MPVICLKFQKSEKFTRKHVFEKIYICSEDVVVKSISTLVQVCGEFTPFLFYKASVQNCAIARYRADVSLS